MSALNVILNSPNDVDSISELQSAPLKEKIKIVPVFDAASLYVKIRRQMEIKIMIEYLSIYRQTSKLTIGKLFEINSQNLLPSFWPEIVQKKKEVIRPGRWMAEG